MKIVREKTRIMPTLQKVRSSVRSMLSGRGSCPALPVTGLDAMEAGTDVHASPSGGETTTRQEQELGRRSVKFHLEVDRRETSAQL